METGRNGARKNLFLEHFKELRKFNNDDFVKSQKHPLSLDGRELG
jgi:hypothetical protein